MAKQPWDMKYLPSTVDEYIFQNAAQKETIIKILEDKTFQPLILSGHRGTGKTSLAYLIKSEYGIEDSDWLKINGADENDIGTVRVKVKSFVSSMAMSFDFKIVFIDEADRLSASAQDALKGIMEEYKENARFIFTTNKPHKIIPELKSRCFEIEFPSLDREEMTFKFATILQKEKINVTDLEILDEYVNNCYPDFRKLLITAEQSVRKGTLPPMSNVVSDTTEFMVTAIEFIESDNWEAARTYLAANVPDDRWDECYRFLYDYLHELGKFKDTKKWKSGIVIIADHLYRHGFVADAEMNFAACLIRLSEV
jgi:replication factor C small subunit